MGVTTKDVTIVDLGLFRKFKEISQAYEARFPFLDEDVIRTLLDIPLWEIADLDQPSGVGDKIILREISIQYSSSWKSTKVSWSYRNRFLVFTMTIKDDVISMQYFFHLVYIGDLGTLSQSTECWPHSGEIIFVSVWSTTLIFIFECQ
ncbi:hypothetical protein POM88_020045 [Heracleum sosnowskyi]|uniref:Uncharacterized protein n=1 Tax=Heracleum sosnowskyi TaxID=360622 RepID=A0AAD8IB74_9APIA|nr:hypothetical protein POM88_020045 [Heracleum sosnowskyi]